MNGAEGLMRAAVAAGVEVCFTNPGTTEMHMVGALDSVPGIRAVLALFEGVATGAADGYGRMADKPAMTLLHLGPGHANGLANLHNARRARTPVLAVIGDHPSWHLVNDAPLTSDIESLARPVSKFVRRAAKAQTLGADTQEAIAAACALPAGVATLIVPGECAWDALRDGDTLAQAPPSEPRVPDDAALAAVADALRGDAPAALLLDGSGLRGDGLRAAGRIARATGCELLAHTFVSRVERGAGLPAVAKIPYFPEQARALLEGFARLVLVGATAPVAFFGYPGQDGSVVPPGCEVLALASPDQHAASALEALADRLGAAQAPELPVLAPPATPTGALDPGVLGGVLASVQPEGAIVMDEAATSGFPYWAQSASCAPHDYLGLTGGAIGQGLPAATGAAVACPERPVIAFQADGSGMYTLQSLWTQAREGLDVTTVVCANREYRILRVELARADIANPGPQAQAVTSLADPVLDWVALARGMGVPGVAVDDAEGLARELRRAFAEPGPHLIEARI